MYMWNNLLYRAGLLNPLPPSPSPHTPPAGSEHFTCSSKDICWKPPTLFENNEIYCISFVYETEWGIKFQVPNYERSVIVVILYEV